MTRSIIYPNFIQRHSFYNVIISGENNGSKPRDISPCSSEEFFQNFPKRATFRSTDNENEIAQSPTGLNGAAAAREAANKNKCPIVGK